MAIKMITKEQLKNLEGMFQLCEFGAEEHECQCKNPTPGRAWFERTNPEIEEGEYYCDGCGIKHIEETVAFYDKCEANLDKELLEWTPPITEYKGNHNNPQE